MSVESVTQRARDATKGVTEGPWRWEWRNDGEYGPESYIVTTAPPKRDGFVVAATSRLEQGFLDAEFIAAARSLVPELVERIEELEAGLQPFADAAEFTDHAQGTRKVSVDEMAQMRGVSIGDCRRARALLSVPTEPRSGK